MHTPQISILFPVYNGAEYLSGAINSLLQQSFKNFEILLINDGSTDDSQKVIETFDDKRIKKILHRKNKGLISTLNEGLILSRGEYIARMDQDDLSSPNRLEKQLTYLQNHPNVSIVGSLAGVMNEKGEILEIMPVPIYSDDISFGLSIKNCFIHGSVMLNRKMIPEEVLSYPTESVHAEDYAFWINLRKNNLQMHNLPEVLYFWRSHGKSISRMAYKEQSQTFNHLFEDQDEYRRGKNLLSLLRFYFNAVTKLPSRVMIGNKRLSSNLKRDYQYILYTWGKCIFSQKPLVGMLVFFLTFFISPANIIYRLIDHTHD
jgi:glycosyltransferase involved in cell wall biosynthesis